LSDFCADPGSDIDRISLFIGRLSDYDEELHWPVVLNGIKWLRCLCHVELRSEEQNLQLQGFADFSFISPGFRWVERDGVGDNEVR
jgi:hypothetical protein